MKKILFLILSIFISFLTVLSQEKIEYIYQDINRKMLKSSEADLELPFFDDFSEYTFYPDNKKWVGDNVFVNYDYPINPPSLGVATLDAVKNTGEFYSNAGYNNSVFADTLCSRPINLEYPNNNTIYLSFYYQPQGLGDNPESKDSLILEFYSSTNDQWYKEWSVKGDDAAEFKQIMININDAKYLQKSFRFRFINKISLSSNTVPSKVINADHWQIDYVYLNKDRSASDTNPKDIAFVYPMRSFLKHYEAMPWRHFLVNTEAQLSKTTKVVYKNNDNQERLIDSIYYEFIDNQGQISKLNGGSYDIAAGETRIFNPPYTYGFLSDAEDSTSFTIRAKFVTDEYDRTVNNTLIYHQKFYDYYSYDDGTAEASYGLTGDGAQKARLAYKFNCVKKDTLKAVQMYFCRSLHNKSKKYFNLTIWDDNEGKPGKIIYQKQAVRPEYENKLNKFHTYYINDETVVLQGVFYVGWVQNTSAMLNIGLDFNTNNQENILYSMGDSWQNSKYEASLMIRPFFGQKLTLSDKKVKLNNFDKNFVVYPNPASKTITVSNKNERFDNRYEVFIYNLSGQTMYNSTFKNNQPINIEHLKKSVYILRITDKNKATVYVQKIIKSN